MKKMLYLITSIISVTLLISCSSFNNASSKRLTPSEVKTLEIYARNAILSMPSKRINPKLKKFVKDTDPVFKAFYTTSKRGKYTITWMTDSGKVIQVVGEGDMLEFSRSFRKIVVSSFQLKSDK